MKKFLRSFLILVLALMPILVNAEGETNTLEGTDLTSPDAEFTIVVRVASPTSVIKSYQGQLSYESDVLELVSISNEKDWEGNNPIGKSPVDLLFTHKGEGLNGSAALATIKFKVKSDCTKNETVLKLVGNTTVDEEGANLEPFTKTIAIRSTDNTLKDLKVNGKTVVNFSPNT